MAPICRATAAPERAPPRSHTAVAQALSTSSSGGRADEPMCPSVARCRSTDSSTVRAGVSASRSSVEPAGWPTRRSPVVEKTDVRLSTRAG
jgi:hypothetical protein